MEMYLTLGYGHEKCQRQLRVVKVNDVYMIQGRGKHGEIPNGKKRANSTLSVEQDKLLRFALNQGGRPEREICN